MFSTNKRWVFVCIHFLLGLVLHGSCNLELNHRLRLHKNLFNATYYTADIAPVLENSDILSVLFAFELIKIVEVHWVNPLLAWNESEFGGIQSLHVPARSVWVPDIMLYNNIDSQENFAERRSTYRADVVLFSNGTNIWRSQVLLKSICDIKVTFFPFDNQTCQLKFGSWTHDSRYLDIQPDRNQTFPTKSFQENDEWDVYKVRMRRNEEVYQCCVDSFVDVTLTIEMGRNSMDYFITLIVPCCLISSMIFLGFVLPPESGERVGLSITVLLAMTVFQQLTSEMVPSYNFPILAQYYFAIIMEIGASVLVTTVILNVYHRTNRKMPQWIRSLVMQWIATIVFLKDTPEKRKINHRKSNRKSKRKMKEARKRVPSKKTDYVDQHSRGFCVSFGDTIPRYYGPECSESLNVEMQHVANQTSFLPNTFHNSSTDHNSENERPFTDDGETFSEDEVAIRHWEWTLVARILDRLFLVIAIICGVVTVSAIFLRAPKLWSDYTKMTLENSEYIVDE